MPNRAPGTDRPLTSLERHLRRELLALVGLPPAVLARARAAAAASDVRDLHLVHAVGEWLVLVTRQPLAFGEAMALGDRLTDIVQRIVEVRVIAATAGEEADGGDATVPDVAIPLWEAEHEA